jgi:hypothetical protein
MSKRKANTQGIHVTYSNWDRIFVKQLHNKVGFYLLSGNKDTLTTICDFLDKQPFINSYTFVVDNTALTHGYLISINTFGESFINLKDFV